MNKNENLLRSWKEIAAYLGCDKRTCLRWEKKLGLPVHRVEGGIKGSVFAYREEIDGWIGDRTKSGRKDGESQKSTAAAPAKTYWLTKPRFLIPFHLALWALIAVVVLALTRKPFSHIPGDFRIDGSLLIVTNKDGREIWRNETGIKNLQTESAYKARFQRKTVGQEETAQFPWIGFSDINHDSRLETLFVTKTLDQLQEGEIFCFDDRGAALWRFKAGREQTIGGKPFSADYRIGGFDTFDANQDGREEVIFFATHKPDFPCQLAVLGADGRLLGEYWNPGHINDFVLTDLNADGRAELIVCGVNNEYGRGFLAVFSPLDVQGAAPQVHDEFMFKEIKPGSEKIYIMIPRTDADIGTYPVDSCDMISISENKELSVLSHLSRLLYEFSFALEPLRVRTSHQFQVVHQKAVEAKRVTSVLSPAYYEDLKQRILYWDGELKKWARRRAVSNRW